MGDTRQAAQDIAAILAPEPVEPPKDPPPEEKAVEPEVPEPVEAESEAEEAETEEPVEAEGEPEAEADEAEDEIEKYVIELDDGERELTADELREIVKSHTETSAERERISEKERAIRAEEEKLTEYARQAEQVRQQYLERLDQLLKADEEADPRPQYEDFEDFETYTLAKDQWENRKEQRARLQAQQAEEMERNRQLQMEQWQSHRASQAHLLSRKAPSLTEEKIKDNVEWLSKNFEFNSQELDPYADHRYTLLLDYARKGWEMEQKKPKVLKKVAGKPKVQKPGSPPSKAEIASEESAAKFNRLQKTGDYRDAAQVIADML